MQIKRLCWKIIQQNDINVWSKLTAEQVHFLSHLKVSCYVFPLYYEKCGRLGSECG